VLSNVGSVLPIRLVAQGNGQTSYFILNRAVTNFLLVGRDVGIAQDNVTQYSLIDPLGSLTVTDAQDWYAICGTPGATCDVDVTPNASNASVSPAIIAEQIALAIGTFDTSGLALDSTLQDTNTTLGTPAQDGTVAGVPGGIAIAGVPLQSLSGSVISSTGSIATANSFTSAVTTIPQIGYEIFLELNASVLETSAAIVDVALTWTDPTTGFVIDKDEFAIAPGTTPGQCLVVGSGQTKAGRVQVVITNGGVQSLGYSFQMLQNSRIYSREDWHSLSAVGNPVIAATNSNVASGLIASSSISIGAGATINRLLPLYSGLIEICVIPPAQSGQIGIQTLDPNAPVADLIGLETIVASTPLNFTHALSRAQCQLNIKNTGAATGTFQILATVVETPG
jgi:hypothetical protein